MVNIVLIPASIFFFAQKMSATPTVHQILVILPKTARDCCNLCTYPTTPSRPDPEPANCNNPAEHLRRRHQLRHFHPVHALTLRRFVSTVVLLADRPDVGVNVDDIHAYCVPSDLDSVQHSPPLIEPVHLGHNEIARLLLTDPGLGVNLP